ncbi:MAG TPA: WXG100 family type VII secretion target, partial [Amycolatopsis sp.]|nr:WXG100 family type VII secretion target [Amycolatopsis sp.]
MAYLSELADGVGLIDPVEAYLRPLLADWGLLRQEADRLRSAATVAEAASGRLTDRLGALDAGWAGKDADAFVAYIRQIGVAGGDLADALNALAGALNELVTSLRHIVVDLVEVLVATAEVTSESAMLPIGGTGRARSQLEDAGRSAKALFEAGRDVLEAFRRLCDGVDDPGGASRAIEITHHYPQERFKLHDADVAPASAGTTWADVAGEATTPSNAQETQGRKTGSREPQAGQG